MEKVRVYELAKELNTTSKRLMEKLAEINIEVKNHMSYLEEGELEALYKHIGVIRHDAVKADADEKKTAPVTVPRTEPRKDIRKDSKNAPRIIRTTEIIVNTHDNSANTASSLDSQRRDLRGGFRDESKGGGFRRDHIKVTDASSGLRAGFVRDTRPDLKSGFKQPAKVDTAKTEPKTTAPAEKAEIKHEVSTGNVPEAKTETRPEPKVEAKLDEKTQAKPSTMQESSDKAKAEANVEKKPEIKADQKPETKREEMTVAGDEGQQSKAMKEDAAVVGTQMEAKSISSSTGIGEKPAKVEQASDKAQIEAEHKNDNASDKSKELMKNDREKFVNKQPSGSVHKQQPNNTRDSAAAKQDAAKPSPGKSQGAGHAEGFSGKQAGRQAEKKPQGMQRSAGKVLDIPKPDLLIAQVEEANSLRSEIRREYQSKDLEKGSKREQKRDIPKTQIVGKEKKFKPQNVLLPGKKGVSEILSEDFILDEFYDDTNTKKIKKAPKQKKEVKAEAEQKHIPKREVLTHVTLPESLTVKELAERIKKTSTEVIKKLMNLGMLATINQEIDFDTAALAAAEFGITADKEVVVNEEDILFDDVEENPEDLEPRPPVVVVMGHVDHGKTSLLDAIRKTNIIDTEAGGITQHIGAYMVEINGRKITFLDTPGHEAFTAMRARGAQVTDIAILVVAADDGVMPQTVEAINHAKAAGVSIIVAINKIDKPAANPERVKQELTEYGLVPEEWGGDAICVPVSAKKGENIDHLLEMVLLTADILELKANPNKQAKGTVIEAKLDKNRGPIATVLVQRGTLRVGDSIVAGTTVGRIRAMIDDKGTHLKSAGPSTPVEILGMPEVPEAGEIFYAITDEKVAKHLVEKRKLKLREQQLKQSARVSLDDLFNQIKEGTVKDLNIIVKADVQGSVEAVEQSLQKLSTDEVRVNIIHGGVGAITESDVRLAEVSNAIIIGFNVRPGQNVAEIAENSKVDLRLYRIIYNAIEDIQAAMKGMLEPTYKEVVTGHAEIRQIFKASGVGNIAGCYVTDGKITRNSDIRIVRNGIVVHEGKLASLKRFKDDVREVLQGFECGLSIERFNDIKEGDIVECFMMEEVKK